MNRREEMFSGIRMECCTETAAKEQLWVRSDFYAQAKKIRARYFHAACPESGDSFIFLPADGRSGPRLRGSV